MNITPRYIHKKVDHDKEFVTEEGHHTNNIEATWATLKKAMPVRYRNKRYLQSYLDELMWRSKHKGILWDALLLAMKNVRFQTPSLSSSASPVKPGRDFEPVFHQREV